VARRHLEKGCAYSKDVENDTRNGSANGTIDINAQDEDSEDHLEDAEGNECRGHYNHVRLWLDGHCCF
jgi:hypothetical protein